ncbi:hypothetical protein CRM22_007143 [Opisthorchis felineus]|uniref:Uncharacterized protein n=1 Tax=Opisthorchis felineus TaxID=147828 RepID=A0A4S2LQ16_OPIFE|nr:hypothetical protein CRM22_007143 [Opisthorchis felineus]
MFHVPAVLFSGPGTSNCWPREPQNIDLLISSQKCFVFFDIFLYCKARVGALPAQFHLLDQMREKSVCLINHPSLDDAAHSLLLLLPPLMFFGARRCCPQSLLNLSFYWSFLRTSLLPNDHTPLSD